MKILPTQDTWYGMTYKEDTEAVQKAFSRMIVQGKYQADLFSDL